ncbi:UDP-glucose 4-epimerase GalE [Stenotrophomonas maltophilia]|uniref:UDP-glucose 4-epimerase GalE n=1 Tax=Stenotrophomonas TaxID=40323 RepID=UPI00063F35CB|nr:MULTISPECIES: UDP-glucose 4-epimerase GalE [Stenotrophomonas]ELC7323639.1 UDP-glucose 4-epimerase GalE [Stenotrophomonas maltophilia]MBA0278635.1 UDP-glucose 4-epimerase GalE [Stenotrophomonas maltophilia]MBA0414062.1 UDP-glucose 4-epimerase GalE [Stenotrophomonas maltophilia]MBA0499359.1 UDP-glucose 4-epimerase GalE [Stenotrophomonas maltophilia]MBA0504005.1 UDP-glucose 4-epimerase GalE [Stenotrophomonas maltophilia]
MNKKRILICGGAGYIGSHMSHWLYERGHQLYVLDNLSTGHRSAVRWGELIEADLLNPMSLEIAFERVKFDLVMHFCARSLVGESVIDPYSYYQNNVTGTLNLLHVMRRHAVNKLIFSSTAAVFGNPLMPTINEQHPKNPINPYGASKLMVERILADAYTAYGISSVALRYFNAAGALAQHGIGEAHTCETHLIPNVLKAALGTGPALSVYGNDYDTLDGTCVRDYVHVQDLALAHACAMDFLDGQPGAHAFNLGNGQGFSVKQVIETAAEVSGRPIPYTIAPRRDGDPAVLVADSERARRELGWSPAWTELGPIIESAWHWHRNQPF